MNHCSSSVFARRPTRIISLGPIGVRVLMRRDITPDERVEMKEDRPTSRAIRAKTKGN